ncbi:MAG TPA: transposase [Pyrinomonadaceae bacterium]|nr:transposase [Pyrinomonadaceae bacterium]
MPDSYTNLLYHIIFSTKDRRPLITDLYQPRLYDYIGGTIRGLGGISLELNGTEDHVHVLTKLRPDKSLSDVLRELKANASGWMHDVFPESEGFLLATWLWRVYRKSVECGGGSTIHRSAKGTSREDIIS